MKENQVFVILKIVGSFRYNHVKFSKFCVQTTSFRFEITYIIKKFNKIKFEFLKIFRYKTTLNLELYLLLLQLGNLAKMLEIFFIIEFVGLLRTLC